MTLYSCVDGVNTVADHCTDSRLWEPTGDGDDGCPCPDGDGLHAAAVRWAATAARCTTARSACGRASQACPGAAINYSDSGDDDACAACPYGDGTYCGGQVNADENTLYNCTAGALSVRQQCQSGDNGNYDLRTPDRPTDGIYCGGAVGDGTRCTSARTARLFGAALRSRLPAEPARRRLRCINPPPPPSAGCSGGGARGAQLGGRPARRGPRYSDYCLMFVNSAFVYGAGQHISQLQQPAAVDAMHAMQRTGNWHPWNGSCPARWICPGTRRAATRGTATS